MTSSHLVNTIQYGDLLDFLWKVNDCRISSRHESVLIRSRVEDKGAARIRVRCDGPLLDERVVVGMGTFEDEGSPACSSADLSLLVLVVFIETFPADTFVVTGKEPIFRVEAIWAKWERSCWSTALQNENKLSNKYMAMRTCFERKVGGRLAHGKKKNYLIQAELKAT